MLHNDERRVTSSSFFLFLQLVYAVIQAVRTFVFKNFCCLSWFCVLFLLGESLNFLQPQFQPQFHFVIHLTIHLAIKFLELEFGVVLRLFFSSLLLFEAFLASPGNTSLYGGLEIASFAFCTLRICAKMGHEKTLVLHFTWLVNFWHMTSESVS